MEYQQPIVCIASGSFHQGDENMFPGESNNKQCVANSMCALAWNFLEIEFNTSNINDILRNGDVLYTTVQGRRMADDTNIYLEPEEVWEGDLMNMNIPVTIEAIEWLGNGLWPKTSDDFPDAIAVLEQIIETRMTEEWTNFLFTGRSSTVSFWKKSSRYLLFDSHGVNTQRVHDSVYPRNNLARLFSCETLKDLACLLLVNAPLNNSVQQYSIHGVKFRHQQPLVEVQDQQPLVEVQDSARTGCGRPKKNKRGRPKIMENTRDDQSSAAKKKYTKIHSDKIKDYQKQYSQKNPEIHRKAVHKHQKNHPDSHRRSVTTNQKNHPDPHRRSVATHQKNHPDTHRKYVATHQKNHPDTHRKSVATHQKNHPDAHNRSVATHQKNHPDAHNRFVATHQKNFPESHRNSTDKYRKEHPDVNRLAVRNYSQQNPDVSRRTSQQHDEQHPQARLERLQRFRANNPTYAQLKHIQVSLRRLIKENGPMGYWNESLRENIQPYKLKKGNLSAEDIYQCGHCGARLYEEEKERKKWCCGEGAYNILELDALTEPFYHNRQFLDRARAYNDLFAFCALEIQGHYLHRNDGLSFFKIDGRMYHQVYSMDAAEGQRFRTRSGITQLVNRSRLYLDDGEERRQIAEERDLNPLLIDEITRFLEETNPFVHQFRMLGQAEPAVHAHLDFEITSRATHGPVLGDRQTGIEVHAVLSTEEAVTEPRRLTIWKEGSGRPTTIDLFSPLVEPFQYPLLYPQGTLGWCINRKDNRDNKLTQYPYYRCLLLSESRFTSFGRLSQAWQVEAFARYEEERLRYIQRAQRGNSNDGNRIGPLDELVQARDRRQVLADVARDETVQGEGGAQPGKVYLPCSFTGGPRYMKVHYENAMGLVSRKGPPTFFLTFTYSAQWEEHKQSCGSSGGRIDPSMACRIFQLKLSELLRDIRTGALFGRIIYIVHIIEMQMRGLPHAHIVFKVEREGPIQPTEIDAVIWATIPSEEEAGGRLRALVLQHMIHGPCGKDQHREFLCWDSEKGRCNKYYEKPDVPTTHVDDRGFVQYKRDHNNKGEVKTRSGRRIPVHDGWVVPYNPTLLLKYEAHINLELASTRRVIKYLFKYLMKGGSLQNVTIVPLGRQNDEIEHYVTKRMVGASDACWRLLNFNISETRPTVECLPIHLEGKQTVCFRSDQLDEAINSASSKLIIYFERPESSIFDGETYQCFYENFMVSTRRPQNSKITVYEHPDNIHFVTSRQRGEKICRLYWVSPNRTELFCLRILLMTIPCRGYNDLLSKGGPGCTTFQELARRLGLVNDEQEYSQALREASVFMVGPRLRSFFVLLCNMGAPAALLWEEFRNSLSEDHLERNPHDLELAYKLSLIDIDRSLRRQGSSLTDHGLPYVQDNTTELGREFLAYGENMQRTIVEEWLPKLSPDQQEVFHYIRCLCTSTNSDRTSSRVIFLDGPGGYGKTQLIRVILADVRSRGHVAIAVASSGIAAGNMPGGTTAHSMFRLPLDLRQGTGVWSITNGSQRAELIQTAQLIVFDEAPMAHRYIFEMLDRSLRDLMKSDEPFGGKIFLCSGDFRQMAPIVHGARTAQDIVCVSLRSSYLWGHFKVFHLTTPQRSRDSTAYSEFLLSVGNGTIPAREFGEGREAEKLVPLEGIRYVTALEELIADVFPANILRDSDECSKRAILAPLNVNVKEINGQIIHSLDGRLYELLSADTVDREDEDGLEVDIQILNHATGKGIPDHVLHLKINCICLIMRNLNIADGLVNGTKVIVTGITPRLITVRMPGGTELFGIPRIIFKFSIVEGSPLQINRRQFPLMLAYGMSGHKSQGQTLEYVGVDCRTIFVHGQLYVLLSRVRTPLHILVLVEPDKVHDGVAFAKNIVYPELLF